MLPSEFMGCWAATELPSGAVAGGAGGGLDEEGEVCAKARLAPARARAAKTLFTARVLVFMI